MALGVVLLVTLFFLVNSWMLYRIQDSVRIGGMHVNFLKVTSSELSIQVCLPFFLTISSSFGKLSLYLSFSSVEICSNISKLKGLPFGCGEVGYRKAQFNNKVDLIE